MEDYTPESQEDSRVRLVERMRTLGKENSEAVELLKSWLDEQDGKVERGEMTNLARNIAWAETYRDAGWKQEAIEAFEDAATQAFEEHQDETLQYLDEELDKLRS